jgi:cytosine/adenosine deaminase-related metal-dependent hydrolase
MTTTHTAETAEQEQGLATSVEYLQSAGYLGNRTLLGHCVQVSEADIQLLAETDTRVAHNIVTNCALGSGVAPVPLMRRYGVTVGLGTDNVDQNHTSNLINDMRFAAMVHKVETGNPQMMSPETVVEMATIEAARAIGRADELGSLEAGKLADIVLLDLDHSQLIPFSDLASALVYQATGTEIETVVCNGDVVFQNGKLVTKNEALPDTRSEVFDRRDALVKRTGLSVVDGGKW